MIYGGTIRAGRGSAGEKLDVVSAFQSYGELLAHNRSTRPSASTSSSTACPGAGACGGMYTANTMASGNRGD